MLQPVPFAAYPSTVTGGNSGRPSRQGARDGMGSQPEVSTAPHPGAAARGRVSQPPAAPASSRPLRSALFRAPGAINRGSASGAAPLRSGPPASPAPPRSPGRASPRLSLEAGGDAGLVTAPLGRAPASRAFGPAAFRPRPRAGRRNKGQGPQGSPCSPSPLQSFRGAEETKLGLGEGLGGEQVRPRGVAGSSGRGWNLNLESLFGRRTRNRECGQRKDSNLQL